MMHELMGLGKILLELELHFKKHRQRRMPSDWMTMLPQMQLLMLRSRGIRRMNSTTTKLKIGYPVQVICSIDYLLLLTNSPHYLQVTSPNWCGREVNASA
jgi:hypothetical protein